MPENSFAKMGMQIPRGCVTSKRYCNERNIKVGKIGGDRQLDASEQAKL